MLTLAAAETIAGIAGTATAITYTITGMELNAGVEAYKVLAQGQLGSSAGTLYTAPSGTQTFVKSLHLANATGSDVSGIKLFKNGTAAGNQITGSLTIPANGWATYEEDGWRVYNSSGERLMNGVTASSSGGGTGSGSSYLPYTFSTTTTDSDPGSGNIRLSISALAASYSIYVDILDANAVDRSTLFAALVASNFGLQTTVTLFDPTSGASWSFGKVTSIVNGSGYYKLVCDALSFGTTGIPTNGASVILQIDIGPTIKLGAFANANNSTTSGVPGYQILSSSNNGANYPVPTNASQSIVVPFKTEVPLWVKQVVINCITSASGRNAQIGIYKAYLKAESANPLALGARFWDSGNLSNILGSTGEKLTTAGIILPPGRYGLVCDIPSVTGAAALYALRANRMDEGVNVSNQTISIPTKENGQTFNNAADPWAGGVIQQSASSGFAIDGTLSANAYNYNMAVWMKYSALR